MALIGFQNYIIFKSLIKFNIYIKKLLLLSLRDAISNELQSKMDSVVNVRKKSLSGYET